MTRYVEIVFDCMPLRSIGRMDVPIDASPKFRARCERIKSAMDRHGTHNTYFLYNAHCTFHLTNREDQGTLEFRFEGTVMTDDADRQTVACDLEIELVRETCSWLTQPVVEWFSDTVGHATRVEFDRYIAAGDLEQTLKRIARLQAESDQHGGFVGMYL